MLTRRIAQIALTTVLAFSGGVYAGPLTGKSVGGTNSTGTLSPAATAAIGPGVEFTADFFTTPFFSIDIDENGLVTVTDILPGGLGHGAGQFLSFFDVFVDIAPITGFDLVSTSGVTGITQADLTFTADSFGMEVGLGTSWSSGDFFTAQLQFAPEPASLLLLGLGLAGIGLARRRRPS